MPYPLTALIALASACLIYWFLGRGYRWAHLTYGLAEIVAGLGNKEKCAHLAGSAQDIQ
jgi:hypothetical protein